MVSELIHNISKRRNESNRAILKVSRQVQRAAMTEMKAAAQEVFDDEGPNWGGIQMGANYLKRGDYRWSEDYLPLYAVYPETLFR